MPELPEVETTVKDLRQKVLNRTFINVWTDTPKLVKKPIGFERFKRQVKGKKIKKIWRRGKNIVFELSEGIALLVHQKMTGHLLIGYWILDPPKRASGSLRGRLGFWKPSEKGPLEERINIYIHLLFTLDNGKMLALSDLRKFAKVELWDKEELKKEFDLTLGPEPLDKDFTFERFKKALKGQRRGIKQVLMDQKVLVGIGNIYSDEILWEARVNPFQKTNQLGDRDLKKIFQAVKTVLERAIQLKGESISDYRRPSGKKGSFDTERKIYRREGEQCARCGNKIQRKKIGGRSAHFCPSCQE